MPLIHAFSWSVSGEKDNIRVQWGTDGVSFFEAESHGDFFNVSFLGQAYGSCQMVLSDCDVKQEVDLTKVYKVKKFLQIIL